MTTTKAALLGSTTAAFNMPAGAPTLMRGPLVALAPPDESGGDGGGPMSLDQAVERVAATQAPDVALKKAEPAREAPAEAPQAADGGEEQDSEAAPTAEDETGQDEPATGNEDAENVDPEAPAIDHPRSWDAEERKVFDGLPDDAKKIILARETERDRAVSKAQTEAHNARKAADTERGLLTQLRPQVEGALEKVSKAYADRWEGVTEADWARWANENPDATIKLRFQFDADKAEKEKLHKTAEALLQADNQKTQAAELAKLPEVCPPLADPKEGKANLQKLGKFLVEAGIAPQQLAHVSATELSLAWDAMQFRALKAKPPQPKPTGATPAPRSPVRPATTGQRSSQTEAARLTNKLSQTRSIDDAADLLIAKGL